MPIKGTESVTPSVSETIQSFLAGEPRTVRAVDAWIRAVICNKGWRDYLDIDDVRQETMQTLLVNLQNGSYKGGSFYSYVIKICLHKCVDTFRQMDLDRRYREQAIEPEYDDALLADARLEHNDRIRLAKAVLRTLDAPCRDLILKIHLHRQDQRDVASTLGISYGALRKRLHDCMKRVHEIRRRLDDDS
ncbi:MAG: hypothetical protein Kow0074_06430 [Candidatus Zixiibacteriota bacterium]